MKTLQQNMWWFALVLLLTAVSCKKELAIRDNSLDSGEQIDNIDNNEQARVCLVTHSDDNGWGTSMDIFYNGHKNPDSIRMNASTIIPSYDGTGRLTEVHYLPNSGHIEFIYQNKELVPSEINLYLSGYSQSGKADILTVIIRLKYNPKSAIVEMQVSNLGVPKNDFAYNCTYNEEGNLTTLINVPRSGTPFTECEFSSYDNKPNFLGGNPWIKYMLLFSGYEPLHYLMFSKNNAVNWSWMQGPSSPTYTFTSTLDYNHYGFVNKATLHVVDNKGNVRRNITRASSSTCDSHYQKSEYPVFDRLPFLPKEHIAAGVIMVRPLILQ